MLYVCYKYKKIEEERGALDLSFFFFFDLMIFSWIMK